MQQGSGSVHQILRITQYRRMIALDNNLPLPWADREGEPISQRNLQEERYNVMIAIRTLALYGKTNIHFCWSLANEHGW
jgi:hypothetical protein